MSRGFLYFASKIVKKYALYLFTLFLKYVILSGVRLFLAILFCIKRDYSAAVSDVPGTLLRCAYLWAGGETQKISL